MAKYGELIKQARKPDDQTDSEPENQKTRKPAVKTETRKPDDQTAEEMVNLCVKVPKKWRSHWAAEAKRYDVTMTDVMVEALKARFGMPD
jgi:hypothetical protein